MKRKCLSLHFGEQTEASKNDVSQNKDLISYHPPNDHVTSLTKRRKKLSGSLSAILPSPPHNTKGQPRNTPRTSNYSCILHKFLPNCEKQHYYHQQQHEEKHLQSQYCNFIPTFSPEAFDSRESEGPTTGRFLQLELESVMKDVEERIMKVNFPTCCQNKESTRRDQVLAALKVAQEYREHILFEEHISSAIIVLIDRLQKAERENHSEKICSDKMRWKTIQENIIQEKGDKQLQKAYHLMMQPTESEEEKTRCLEEAEKLLLDIIPEPVGKVIDLFGGDDYSSKQISIQKGWQYDVEHIIELKALEKMKKQGKLRPLPVSHHYAFHLYVYLLIEKKNFNRAFFVCSEALKRNPFFVHCLFERGEIFKMQKKVDSLFTETSKCLQLCYKAKDLAKCYRNFGYYFSEKKKFEQSIACFLKSLTYEVHPMVKNELQFIYVQLLDKSLLQNSTPNPRQIPAFASAITNIIQHILRIERQQSSSTTHTISLTTSSTFSTSTSSTSISSTSTSTSSTSTSSSSTTTSASSSDIQSNNGTTIPSTCNITFETQVSQLIDQILNESNISTHLNPIFETICQEVSSII